MLTLAEIAREHVDTCASCRARWERGERAVDVQRTCRELPPGLPPQCRVVFVRGERASEPGRRDFIARVASYEVAEGIASQWNVGHDLAWGVFEVES